MNTNTNNITDTDENPVVTHMLLEGDQYCFAWYDVPKSCECGAEKVYGHRTGPLHSRWCPLADATPLPPSTFSAQI